MFFVFITVLSSNNEYQYYIIVKNTTLKYLKNFQCPHAQ